MSGVTGVRDQPTEEECKAEQRKQRVSALYKQLFVTPQEAPIWEASEVAQARAAALDSTLLETGEGPRLQASPDNRTATKVNRIPLPPDTRIVRDHRRLAGSFSDFVQRMRQEELPHLSLSSSSSSSSSSSLPYVIRSHPMDEQKLSTYVNELFAQLPPSSAETNIEANISGEGRGGITNLFWKVLNKLYRCEPRSPPPYEAAATRTSIQFNLKAEEEVITPSPITNRSLKVDFSVTMKSSLSEVVPLLLIEFKSIDQLPIIVWPEDRNKQEVQAAATLGAQMLVVDDMVDALSDNKFLDALEQIFTYMSGTALRWGMLTNYLVTYLIERSVNPENSEEETVYISTPFLSPWMRKQEPPTASRLVEIGGDTYVVQPGSHELIDGEQYYMHLITLTWFVVDRVLSNPNSQILPSYEFVKRQRKKAEAAARRAGDSASGGSAGGVGGAGAGGSPPKKTKTEDEQLTSSSLLGPPTDVNWSLQSVLQNIRIIVTPDVALLNKLGQLGIMLGQPQQQRCVHTFFPARSKVEVLKLSASFSHPLTRLADPAIKFELPHVWSQMAGRSPAAFNGSPVDTSVSELNTSTDSSSSGSTTVSDLSFSSDESLSSSSSTGNGSDWRVPLNREQMLREIVVKTGYSTDEGTYAEVEQEARIYEQLLQRSAFTPDSTILHYVLIPIAAGRDEKDNSYKLVLPLAGPSLQQVIDNCGGILSQTLCKGAKEALTAVHFRGFLHKDIRWSNFVLLPKDKHAMDSKEETEFPLSEQWWRKAKATNFSQYRVVLIDFAYGCYYSAQEYYNSRSVRMRYGLEKTQLEEMVMVMDWKRNRTQGAPV